MEKSKMKKKHNCCMEFECALSIFHRDWGIFDLQSFIILYYSITICIFKYRILSRKRLIMKR